MSSRFFQGVAIATSLLAVATMSWRLSIVDFDPTTVRGQRVLITGATSGIGEAIAYQYARLGAKLVLTASNEAALRHVAATCSRLGAPLAEVIAADLFHRKSRQSVVDATRRLLGGLDVLVVAHGRFGAPGWWYGNGENMTTLFEDLNLNFFGYADLVSRALPMLETSGGAVAVASSIGSHIALPWRSSTAASQFATRGFFQSLTLELRRHASAVSVTLCYLGLLDPGTKAEVRGTEGSGGLALAAPQEAAMAVVEAVSLRNREMYFPSLGILAVLLNAVFPKMVESRIQNFVSK